MKIEQLVNSLQDFTKNNRDLLGDISLSLMGPRDAKWLDETGSCFRNQCGTYILFLPITRIIFYI